MIKSLYAVTQSLEKDRRVSRGRAVAMRLPGRNA